MAAAGVVEAFDVPEEAHSGLFAGVESFASEEFLLEAGEEGFGDRVVPGSPIEPVDSSICESLA